MILPLGVTPKGRIPDAQVHPFEPGGPPSRFADIYRIAGGRVVETWHVEDAAGLVAQLGSGVG
jgi:hypothetical protein